MHSIFLALLLALVLSTGATQTDQPRVIKPVMIWTGADSKQTTESFIRCETQKDWEAIWDRHHNHDNNWDSRCYPRIDFETYMVIVVFSKEGGSDRGLDVIGLTEVRDSIRLRYRLITYQVASGNFVPTNNDIKHAESKEMKRPCRSYFFIVLPKSAKKVVIEEDMIRERLLTEPPKWKERVQLARVQ